jgi:glycoprotein-N-acetylgalactosamine 3-beta-galactosyltransferase
MNSWLYLRQNGIVRVIGKNLPKINKRHVAKKYLTIIFVFIFLIHSTNIYSLFKSRSPSPRIFCMIMTKVDSLDSKAKVVVDTWGKKCDNYKLISLFPPSTLSESSNIASDVYEIGDILRPPGFVNDTYGKLTDKVLLTLKYVYQKYNDYDWYLKADDDTFIFVDNLREFLNDKNRSSPITYGYNFKVIVSGGYHSGGAGYLLSHEALNRIGSALTTDYAFCPQSGMEDVDVAICLRSLDVYIGNSTDEFGRERFHSLSIADHFYGDFPDWLLTYAVNSVQKVRSYLIFLYCHY